jgi:hypothetical protein
LLSHTADAFIFWHHDLDNARKFFAITFIAAWHHCVAGFCAGAKSRRKIHSTFFANRCSEIRRTRLEHDFYHAHFFRARGTRGVGIFRRIFLVADFGRKYSRHFNLRGDAFFAGQSPLEICRIISRKINFHSTRCEIIVSLRPL